MSDIKTNMTDTQLFEMYIKFSKDCEACRIAHHECRIVPPCKECECGFWVRHLAEYFGINLSVGIG